MRQQHYEKDPAIENSGQELWSRILCKEALAGILKHKRRIESQKSVMVEHKESAVALKASMSMHKNVQCALLKGKYEEKIAKKQKRIFGALQKNMVIFSNL